MISGVSIVLIGLPEKVQRVADALDHVLPGSVSWQSVAFMDENDVITLRGEGIPTLEGIPVDENGVPKIPLFWRPDAPPMIR